MSLTTTERNISEQIGNHLAGTLQGTSDKNRSEALRIFQDAGLPSTKTEEYRHTPLTRELEKNFSFAGATTYNPETGIKDFLIGGLEGNVIVFINGYFSRDHSRLDPATTGIVIRPLRDALETEKTAGENFSKHITVPHDAFVAWNSAGWTDGVFIHVQPGAVIEKPVIIHHIKDASAGEVAALTRNLIVTEKNSELTLIEKFDSTGNGNHFLNLVNEIVVGENAGLDLYSVQNDAGNQYQFSLTEISQQNSSRVNTFTITLNGKLVRNNLHLSLNGEGIESHMYGLYLLAGQTVADNHTVVDHRKPNSFSNEMYKGIMDGQSKGIFNGKIFVRPQAQKTNAFQANRNILLTDKASVNTKPQLEIWADDVKCSHGCTSGQLDEEAVFYLRTRGLSKETAQAMMLYAFAAEIITRVKHPVLKAYMDGLISERLHKNF